MKMKFTNIATVTAALALAVSACSVDPFEDGAGHGAPDMPVGKIVNTSSNSAKGSILVKLNDASQADALQARLEECGIVVSPVFQGLTAATTKAGSAENNLARWCRLDFSEYADLDSLASVLSGYEEVGRVQFNTRLKLASDCRSYPVTSVPTKADFSDFNDPQLAAQWHYHNDGSVVASARRGADVNVADAWRLETGRPEVIVAIIDQGVQYNHPDLAQNMWVNTAELTGTPGVDDDNNGYVDDIYGYNFVAKSGEITWTKQGDSGHGTHVAGTVAAVNNNGTGVCGIAGGDGSSDSGVRMMSLQVFDGNAGGTVDVSAAAIRYAADNGASIIQCSWGYAAGAYQSDAQWTASARLEAEALEYFLNGGKTGRGNCSAITDGNIAIFAAGNDSDDMASYPGASRGCISVTSFASDNLPANYTNYGPGCNIAAPGGEYYTGDTYYDETCVLSTMPTESISSVGDDGTVTNTPANYGYMQGTSMACPHMSGVAALGLSYALDMGKTYTREEFMSLLLTSVNDIDSYLVGSKTTLIVNPATNTGSIGELDLAPFYGQMGTGTIDAWRVLMQIEGTPCLVAEVGKSQRLNLDSVFGGGSENLTYLSVEISDDDYDAIGLMTDPVIKGGQLLIQPTYYGSAKLTITAIAGGSQVGGGANIGGMEITKEVSVIARGISNGNGGWL